LLLALAACLVDDGQLFFLQPVRFLDLHLYLVEILADRAHLQNLVLRNPHLVLLVKIRIIVAKIFLAQNLLALIYILAVLETDIRHRAVVVNLLVLDAQLYVVDEIQLFQYINYLAVNNDRLREIIGHAV
jgi:hypothetical protein